MQTMMICDGDDVGVAEDDDDEDNCELTSNYKMGLKNVSAFEMSKKMAFTGFVRQVLETLK